MQKILFVSSKDLSEILFDGAQARSCSIVKSLSKKNKVDFACISNKLVNNKNLNFCNKIFVFKINFFRRIINTIIYFLKLQPMQNGYFHSKEMLNFIEENKDEYQVIIFHLVRCAQYLPKGYGGKTILEVTDLSSANYEQVVKHLSVFNPVKYLYLVEKILLTWYEKKVLDLFDKIVLISKNEIPKILQIIRKDKVFIVGNPFEIKKKVFVHNSNNNKIFFVGNINYLPNKVACYNFVKSILPKINIIYPEIEFNIIGKINLIDKFFLNRKNVVIHGPIKKLDKIFKKSICGVCNVNIATGLQNKIFTYMSYGLPAIISEECFPDNLLKKNKDVLVYKNKKQFLNHIFKLIKSKSFSNKLSKNGFLAIKKKFKPSNTFDKYTNII